MSALRSPTIISATLVGREPQLALLTDLLEQASSGRGRIALIAGEAGIGKSRLVGELAAVAKRHSACTAQAYCFEYKSVLPYGPLIDLLRALCLGRSTDQLALVFGSTAAELVKIYPELSAALPDLTPTPRLIPSRRNGGSFRP